MKYKWLALYLLGFLFHVLFVHLFKQWLADGALRPYAFYSELNQAHLLQVVEGVKIRRFDSFPSGHTTTIFFLVTYFTVLIRKYWASVLLLGVGIVVGMSRIYLVQHWFVDTYVGFLFGLLSTVLAFLVIRKNPKQWHEKQLELPFLNKS
jgi:membrane-associated phospholipid phosphatase